MQLRSEIQLKTMIKAMVDVVMPAMDAENRLAAEQAQLIVGMLRLMEQQLPLQFRFDCDELQRLAETAEAMEALCDGGARSALGAERVKAQSVLARAKADPAELRAAIHDLRAVVGDAVHAAGKSGGDPARAAKIEACVLAMSKAQCLRDRAMLAPQGWELDPGAIPSIHTLLNEKG